MPRVPPPSHSSAPFRPDVGLHVPVRPLLGSLAFPGLGHAALGLRNMARVLGGSALVFLVAAVLLPWGWPGAFLVALLAFRAVLGAWWLSFSDVVDSVRGDAPRAVRAARMDALLTVVTGPLLAARKGAPGVVHAAVSLFFLPVWVISSQHDVVILVAFAVMEAGGVLLAWHQLRGETRALRPLRDLSLVVLMALVTGIVVTARLSMRTFDGSMTRTVDGAHAVLHSNPLQLDVHVPADWTLDAAPPWPESFRAERDGCRARMLVAFAPPLPRALEDIYVQRVLAHLLDGPVVETAHDLHVTTQEARQFSLTTSGGDAVVTLARRNLTWHALVLEGDAAKCGDAWSTVRSSWTLLSSPLWRGP